MSISDRLDEIEARIVRAREGRQTDRYMVLDVDAPALVEAVRAVLDLHKPEMLGGTEFCEKCGTTLYPCSTVRAVTAALGEGHSNA